MPKVVQLLCTKAEVIRSKKKSFEISKENSEAVNQMTDNTIAYRKKTKNNIYETLQRLSNTTPTKTQVLRNGKQLLAFVVLLINDTNIM
jgi:lipopolysaccharide export LptBFGC system permease protein LptF